LRPRCAAKAVCWAPAGARGIQIERFGSGGNLPDSAGPSKVDANWGNIPPCDLFSDFSRSLRA
jgi:hypothetical protein